MCHHCSSSTLQFKEFSNKLSFRVIRNEKEKVVGEVIFKCCCCCGARLDFDTTMYSSNFLIESWYDDVLKDWSAACNDHIQQGCGSDSVDNDRNQEEESASVSMSVDEMEELEAGMDAREDEEIFQEMTWEDVHTDVSIGMEIHDIDDSGREDQESVHSYKFIQDLPSTSSLNLNETDDHGLVQVIEQMVELQSLSSVQNENEEDEVPNTPASVDSLNHFQRNLVFLKKSDIGSGESLDGSVTSELEGGEGVVTIESLKLALRAERKCSQALYAELEEEINASAEAVIQAMAMI